MVKRCLALSFHLLVLVGCAAPPVVGEGRFQVVVLGIAQDGGVPHYGCRRICCEEARRTGRILDPACLAIVDQSSGKAVLVEATPGIERQTTMLREQFGAEVVSVMITHAHVGHYLGLAQFGREVASTEGIPVYGSARFCAFLSGHGPWQQLVNLKQIVPVPVVEGVPFEPLPGVTVTGILVPHRDEYSDTFAWRISGPERTVLFVPDVDRWDAEQGLLERLMEGVDLAFLDATFFDGSELPGRDLREIPHPPMVDTMDRLAEHTKARPGTVRFIHFNHTNPVLRDPALRHQVLGRGFALATQGERHPL